MKIEEHREKNEDLCSSIADSTVYATKANAWATMRLCQIATDMLEEMRKSNKEPDKSQDRLDARRHPESGHVV